MSFPTTRPGVLGPEGPESRTENPQGLVVLSLFLRKCATMRDLGCYPHAGKGFHKLQATFRGLFFQTENPPLVLGSAIRVVKLCETLIRESLCPRGWLAATATCLGACLQSRLKEVGLCAFTYLHVQYQFRVLPDWEACNGSALQHKWWAWERR